MMKNNFSYFRNTECEYYPCHKTENEFFNCLFCYCPLYVLGEDCGGNFTFTPQGIKDCSNCLIPHSEGGYLHVMSKFEAISDLAKRKEK